MCCAVLCCSAGCGLPPGPFGLLGAAEGLSYLTVLGFAGAGVSARVNSGGKQGLQGVLAVPETLAYGALGAGLLVMASQVGVGQLGLGRGCTWHAACCCLHPERGGGENRGEKLGASSPGLLAVNRLDCFCCLC